MPSPTTTGNYTQTIGRRKTSIAQVRLLRGKGEVTVNGRALDVYFPLPLMQKEILSPLKETGLDGQYDITAKISGGGVHGQAGALRLGIARGLLIINKDFRTVLKKHGFLSRDARKRERKKPGKKSARRSPQWAKR